MPKDLANISEEELKTIDGLSLIDYSVHVKTLAENKDVQAFSHLVNIPSMFLKDAEILECTLDYPLNEQHTFQIIIDKVDMEDMGMLDLNEILLAIANEYKMLWNEHNDLFWGHSWGDLWIEELVLRGNRLEISVGS